MTALLVERAVKAIELQFLASWREIDADKRLVVKPLRQGRPGSPCACWQPITFTPVLSGRASGVSLSEDGVVHANPCGQLSKSTRAKWLRPAHDPRRTPFIESMEDVIRVYQALKVKSPTVAVAYAVGALAGLRTSEVRALDWSHVDIERGTIHVQVQVERRKGRDPKTWSPDGTQVLKDGESRVVPIQPSLASLLASWREIDGGKGLVVKPLRQGSRRFLDDHTMSAFLRDVLIELKLAREGLG
jgi:integrase